MSVVDQLKKLFSKKSSDSSMEPGGDLSLAMPDASLDPLATGSMEPTVTRANMSALAQQAGRPRQHRRRVHGAAAGEQ